VLRACLRDHGSHDQEKMLALKGTHGKLALLRAGNLQLELFQFTSPVPKRNDPNRPVADHGITHFCIEVSDIQAVYAQLEAAGASFHSPPIEFEGFATATYVRDPDGNVFEIMERGKQVESE